MTDRAICTDAIASKKMPHIYNRKTQHISLSDIKQLQPHHQFLDQGAYGNFSISGFEMVLTRYVSTYIITYYLPSGKETFLRFEYSAKHCFSRIVCDSLLDFLPDTHGCDPRPHGSTGHSVPGASQYLQHSHHQHSKGGGAHSYRGLDVGLYSLRVWSFI